MSAPTGSVARPQPARGSADNCALSYDLGWALGTVFRSYVKAADQALADLPGGPRGYQILAAAARDDHGNQQSLAQHLGVDRTVLTYLLDDLEGAGLIERHPDPADRRARRIVATAPGRDLLGALDQQLRAAEDQVLAGLGGQEERATFRALLRQLAVAANALDPVHSACDVAKQVRAAGEASTGSH